MDGGPRRTALLAALALLAFAGNSLLCRAALAAGHADPAAFTLLRLTAGAAMLLLLVRGRVREGARPRRAALARATCLSAYAALFSWAYVRIPAGVGALVLFAFVQLSMLGWTAFRGAGPSRRQSLGAGIALVGLALLAAPGLAQPDPLGVFLMALSGVAWGAYSLLGRRASSPTTATAAAFVGAVPLAVAVAAVSLARAPLHADAVGALGALVSGAVTSALGYVAWYAVLPSLGAARAGVLQLAVPVLTALAGVLFLGEDVTLRTSAACATILVGVALALRPVSGS